jgi:RNA polymerase sigma-70 factor (ECF subfamily)
MFKIYNNLQTFDPAHSFKAWIYQISRNHCLDFLKSRAVRLLDASKIQDKDIPGSDSPERIAMKIEIQGKIDQIINSLSSRDKEIAFLRFSENLKSREISQITGLNLNSTKARIRWIRMRLKKDLGRYL